MLLLLLLLWAVGGYAFHRIDRSHNERHYDLLVDLIAHKKALADVAPSPRVIIAGGSNAYYGIDSHVLEERFRVPVVNFAFPFGAFHDRISLHLVEELVRPGDVVVYAASSLWSSDPWPPDKERRAIGFDAYLAEQNFAGYQRRFEDDVVPWQARPQTNTLLLALLEQLSQREEGGSWVEDTDDRGDFTGCVPVPVVTPQRYDDDDPHAELAAHLHTAAERLKTRAHVFLSRSHGFLSMKTTASGGGPFIKNSSGGTSRLFRWFRPGRASSCAATGATSAIRRCTSPLK